jgi:hypothetical protein
VVVSPATHDEAVGSFHLSRQDASGAQGRWIDGFQEEWGELA